MMYLDTILHGEVLAVLKTLPSESVHTVITSPPYYGLRDYGTAQWVGGDPDLMPTCDHRGEPMRTRANINANCATGTDGKNAEGHQFYKVQCGKCGALRLDQQIGLELTIEDYVARLVAVFAEVRRVLRKDGTLWCNLGDSYASDWPCNRRSTIGAGSLENGKRSARPPRMPGGMQDKGLMGVPWRVALALQADGWILRSDIIWHKPNPMPESVTDRPTKAHEYLFMLAKSGRYYYDAEAIAEPAVKGAAGSTFTEGKTGVNGQGRVSQKAREESPTRNKRSVWTVSTVPYDEAHFATFPPKLIEPCVLAGTSHRNCEHCGAPWRRVIKKVRINQANWARSGTATTAAEIAHRGKHAGNDASAVRLGPVVIKQTVGWWPTCTCAANTGAGKAVVLDPFFGSGTTGVVAVTHSRHYLGIDLNAEYIEMARRRIDAEGIQRVLWSA